jgi:hypothetical protein
MILQQSDETYIYLWRKLLNSEIWEMPNHYLRVWLWILLRVNYETGRIDRSMNNIGQECAYRVQGGCPRTIKPKQVSDVLEWLESKKMIIWEKAGSGNARYSVITVINWESFQDPHQINSNKEETEDKQTINEQETETHIYNNKSNKLNKKDIPSESETESKKEVYTPSENAMRCINEWHSKRPIKMTDDTIAVYGKTFDDMERIDKLSWREIGEIVKYALTTWTSQHIQAPSKLRSKNRSYPELKTWEVIRNQMRGTQEEIGEAKKREFKGVEMP